MELSKKSWSFKFAIQILNLYSLCLSNYHCAGCSVRTPISMKFFPRFFLLYFLVFHIYFFSYAYGTSLPILVLFIFIYSISFIWRTYLVNRELLVISRIFLFGAFYNRSIYASSHPLLLESFWGNHYKLLKHFLFMIINKVANVDL